MKLQILGLVAAIAPLAACAPATAPAPEPVPAAVVAPITPVQGISGLQDREPDLCKASEFVPYLSQPGGTIPTLGITKPYRVVEYRGIEPQDYDPNRIVFRLDAAGNIYNIDCG